MTATDPIIELDDDQVRALASRGVTVPDYDRSRLVPRIVHIGVGGFHRAHLAVYCDDLAQQGGDWGICGVGLLASDRAMADALAAQDCWYTVTTRHDDRSHTRVVGSIIDYVHAPDDPAAAVERIAAASTSIVSMTVTEAGYRDDDRNWRTFDVIAAGLAGRREHGRGGVTISSCDNMVANGEAARRCVLAACDRADPTLAGWVDETCTFPNSMVDRITPGTTDADRAHLVDAFGLVDRWPVVAEPFRQWVVEDDFAAGRPDLAAVDVVLTDDVTPWEHYKLRLLNAGHAAIAHLGALAGFEHVDMAVADPDLGAFLRSFLLDESAPTLTPIAGFPTDEYAATVIDRFSNSGIRDQVARLCVDGTAKVAVYLLPILRDRLRVGATTDHLAHVLAAWAHYLAAVPADEQAPDPAMPEVRPLALAALDEPARFLTEATGFGASETGDPGFVRAFTRAHRSIAEVGPLPALRRLAGA